VNAASRTAVGRAQQQGWEKLAFIAVLAVLGLGVLLWGTGEVSGFLATGRRPGTTFSQMGEVVLRLFEDLDNPRRAWPRPLRSHIAGPVLFYAVLVILSAVAAAISIVTYRLFKGSLSHTARGSTWASLRDLRQLIVKHALPGRLVLGRVGSKLVAAEERQSVIVLGPTQSMKTSGFAVPAILEWRGPVLATSVKSDLLANTLEARRRSGEVWVYDPTSSTGAPRSGWSPLASCDSWHGAQRTAAWLAGATTSRSTGLAEAEFWYQAAAKLLGPLLLAAARSGATMSDVVRWVNLQEQAEVNQALQGAEQAARDAAAASFKREARQKSSVYTTAETVLSAYEDPVVAESAATCDITPEALFDRSWRSLYVVAPSHEQKRLRPLFETLLHTVVSYAFEKSSRANKPLDPPLLVVLDEAANIAPLRDLDALASTAASHGIQLVNVFQDLAQITTRYGERAHTVVNNHRAKIVLSGISDTQTLEYASRLLGDEEVLQSSVTRGAHGDRSTTESVGLRSLAPAHVLRGIRPGEGVLVYGHLPPARLRLRPWFRERHLLTQRS
jgi:type IV secretion system protein VirD4